MDIDLARTFLEIVRTGSFIAAAEKLHVTQTTVTARIHNLEKQLESRLFIRNRSGATLTDDGEHFLSYANQLVHTWEAARRDLPLPRGSGNLLILGAEISLWNPLLLNWIARLRRDDAELAIRVEVGEREVLQEKLLLGSVDAALMHQPEYLPAMQVEELLEEKLIQVQSVMNPEPYIYVDWGPAFRRQHDVALPLQAQATMSLDLGPLALQYLIQNGGRGYFRTRVVQAYLDEGVIERTPEAPEFSYPIYLVYSREQSGTHLQNALNILHQFIHEDATWHQ
jgi:DNA-binding transcriptional LysR family regulator